MKLHRLPLVPPDAVIFDMDGVIADTRDYHLQAFQELGARHGAEMTSERFQKMFGLANPRFLREMFDRPLTETEIRQFADWKEARYRELIAASITLLPGVQDLIDWLRELNRPMAVASNAPRANVEQILSTAGLRQYFQAVAAWEDVTHPKPHPEIFLVSAAKLSCPPARAWVIEDSLHGIEAALAGGIPVIGVATTHPAAELAPANVVYDDLAELVADLRNHSG